jgi:taurine transport system substrate-binding protein
MTRNILFAAALAAALFATAAGATGHTPGRISVGYLKHWPTPALFAQIKDSFDYALGMEVEWIPFEQGNDMNAAMAAGEIQIAYSQGHVPFLVGLSDGLDLTMVGVAVGYPEDDNCIVRADAGIDRSSATQLAGKKVVLRKGSLSHFRLLGVLDHLGVDPGSIKIVAVANGEAAAEALQRGEATMACASGSALRAMQALGKPLLSGEEQAELGLKVFDTITVPSTFVHDHPETVQAFMDIVEAANKQWKKNPQPMLKSIARAADMDRQSARDALERFSFPSALEQKSDAWLGGQVAEYSKDLAEFFVAHGQLSRSLEDYERFVTTRFLR